MVQISLQTREERVEMYKKCTKLQLIEMLVECNLHLEELTKQLHKLNVGGPASASVSEGEQLGNEALAKSVCGEDKSDCNPKCSDYPICFCGA